MVNIFVININYVVLFVDIKLINDIIQTVEDTKAQLAQFADLLFVPR